MIEKDAYGWIWEIHKCKGNHQLARLVNGNVDNSWQLQVGDSSASNLKYCPYCGKRLKESSVIQALSKLNKIKTKKNLGAGI